MLIQLKDLTIVPYRLWTEMQYYIHITNNNQFSSITLSNRAPTGRAALTLKNENTSHKFAGPNIISNNSFVACENMYIPRRFHFSWRQWFKVATCWNKINREGSERERRPFRGRAWISSPPSHAMQSCSLSPLWSPYFEWRSLHTVTVYHQPVVKWFCIQPTYVLT